MLYSKSLDPVRLKHLIEFKTVCYRAKGLSYLVAGASVYKCGQMNASAGLQHSLISNAPQLTLDDMFASPRNKQSKLKTLLLLWIALAFSTIEAINCPANCKCAWVLDSLEVNCARSGLTEYPVLDQIPVEHLDLSFNYFIDFPSQLATIDSLIYLDLSSNLIEYIDAEALLGFNALRTLLLANNSIASWASINPNLAFLNAVSLKRLSLNGNRLTSFTAEDSKLLLRSESLTHLELEACDIRVAGGDLLINGLPNLERLSLSKNALSTLNALPSKSLRALELSNCKLPRFGGYMLPGLPNLEALNLSWNAGLQFGDVEKDVIISPLLNELDVSYCNMDELNLSGLPSLSTLHLRSNMLREITVKTFANNTLLEVIDLSRNALRLLASEAFSQLKRLVKLDLSYNEIARLDRTIFRANEMLVSLNLSRNVIEQFTKLISNSLRDINLSWCEIITIDSTAFAGLSALQRLDLSNNLIKEFPSGTRSATLQELNLSNCKLSALRNNTFREFPELASLHLNGNRFTNPFSPEIFRSNKFLDQIWIGDNPWICNCHDTTFMDFYDYLTAKPQKLKDKNNVRCASPATLYGQTWEIACHSIWLPNGQTSSAEKVFSTIMLTILGLGGLVLLIACSQKLLRRRKRHRNQREYQRNTEEMHEIRRQNQRMLEVEAAPNAPTTFETNLPSYEDAILMPKLERPVKSMVDLTATARARKKLERSRTDPEEVVQEDNDLMLDQHQRFRSEEMLSNRDKERTAQIAPYRRTGFIEHNNSGSRRFSIEDSRFPASSLKSQNLQSAEQIGNFQSYENSPYTKRKPKIAEIPPFKRATLIADSVEFLTDPEFDAQASKPGSPFARRKPKLSPTTAVPPTTLPVDVTDCQVLYANTAVLAPAVEDYFGSSRLQKSRSTSSIESNFQVIAEPEVASLADDIDAIENTSDEETVALARGKRKHRKNSTSRRASGNFTAATAAAAADASSSSDTEPIVVVHKPMRETLF